MTHKLQKYMSASIPRVLSLLDKNPYSPTYGSFDRKYWHYKIIDFPSGMQQELVRPLGYVWSTEFEGNRFYQNERIAEYIKSAFIYHGRSIHPDGSLDDYFPHERAFGATAYALAALTETAIETGLCPTSALQSLEASAEFVSGYREAGKLSNHLAIAACALVSLYELTGKTLWKTKSDHLLSEVSRMQRTEGWFPEYEGCDLGYQTVTIEFLARIYARQPDPKLFEMLKRCIVFVRAYAHPDGSIGGEFCSRNTYNFYPGGFAILSGGLDEAAEMMFFFLKGLREGSCNYLEDDGVFGHMLSSYVTALKAPDVRISASSSEYAFQPVLHYAGESGFFTGRTGTLTISGSGTKGGVFKVFREDRLIWSDTGFAGKLADGTFFFQNKPDISTAISSANAIRISGRMQKFAAKRLGRIQMIGLRMLSLFFGRFQSYSNAIRFIMQKLLIYNRSEIPLGFTREITLKSGRIVVRDALSLDEERKIVALYRSTDCVNMHVVTSDSFQIANLLPWEELETPSAGKEIILEKVFEEKIP